MTQKTNWKLRLLPILIILLLAFAVPSASALVSPQLLYDQIEPHVDVIILRDDQIGITVQRSKPNSDIREKVGNVPVTITTKATSRTIAHTETISTGSDTGVAVFDIGKFRTEEQIKASRYFDIELTISGSTRNYANFHADEIRAISGKNLLIMLDQDTQKPYIHDFTFNGRDVMFSQLVSTITPKNDANHTFTVKLQAMGHTEAITGKLFTGTESKPDKELASLSVSPSNNQYVFNFTDKWLQKLSVGKQVIFQWTVGSTSYTYTSSMVCVDPVIPEPNTNKEEKTPKTSFSMKNGKLQITVPTGVPFLAGFTFTLDVPKMPIMFYLDTTGEMMFGAVFSYGVEPFSDNPDKKSWKQTNNDKISDWMDESVEKFKKDIAKMKDNVNPEKGVAGKTGAAKNPSFELTFQIGGTMRGKNALTKNDPLTIESTIFASIEGKLKFKKQFMAGPIPFFIGAEITASVEVVDSGVIYTDRKDPLKDMKNGKGQDMKPKTPEASMKITASLGVAVKLGIGIDGVACVWAQGGVAAIPSITIAVPTDPAKPFPHFEFKMNFSIKAGVKLLWISYQIEPLSYDLLVADNWHKAPPTLPYWQPTTKKMAVTAAETTDDGGTIATSAEMQECCIAELPEDYFANLQTIGDPITLYTVNTSGETESEAFQPYFPAEIPIASAHWGSSTVLSDNIPYENDVIPYTGLNGEEREDAYGVVKPVDEKMLLENTYYNSNCKTLTTAKGVYFLFVANVKIQDEYVPTLMLSTTFGGDVLKNAIPILMDDKEKRYVLDFDMSTVNNESQRSFDVDIVVTYSKGKDARTSYMGMFNYKLAFDWDSQKLWTYAKKELNVDTSANYYKALHPRVVTNFHGQSMIAWQMQFDMEYKSYTFTKPAICCVYTFADYASNNVHWSERELIVVDYPMRDLVLIQDNDYQTLFLCCLSRDRKLETDVPFIETFDKGVDHNTLKYKELKKVDTIVPNAYKAQKLREHTALVTDSAGSLHVVDSSNRILFKLDNAEMALPVDYATSLLSITGSGDNLQYDLLCYWGDSQSHTQGNKDYPVYDDYDRVEAKRIVLLSNKTGWAYRKGAISQEFTLCGLDKVYQKVKLLATDAKNALCGMLYTYVPDVKGYSGNIYTAQIPNVAAIEIEGMTTNDPCVGKNEKVGVFFDMVNSGNLFLTGADVEIEFYRKDQDKPFSTKKLKFDLTDANKIIAGVNELDFDKLGEDEVYVLDETHTLEEAMNTPSLRDWFDQRTSFDTETLSSSTIAKANGKVKLEYLSPGEKHLYYQEIEMPKDVTGLVIIKSKVTGYTVKTVFYTPESNAVSSEPEAESSDYYSAKTTGGSTTINHAHPVIEGSLIQNNDSGMLTLNLRNENPDQMDMTLKIYGDETLLLEKEFTNICQGAALAEGGYVTDLGYTSGTAGENEAGYVNIIIPVKDLTQGQNFSYLRAELWPPEDSPELLLDGLEYDDIEFMLRTTDFLRVDKDLESLTVYYKEDVTFTASGAGGKTPYTFYWQKQNESGDWVDIKQIKNATESTLSLKSVRETNAGMYRCLITDGADTVSTSEVSLTVVKLPPITGDGFPLIPVIALGLLSIAGALKVISIKRKGKKA